MLGCVIILIPGIFSGKGTIKEFNILMFPLKTGFVHLFKAFN